VGYSLKIESEQVGGWWEMVLSICLSRAEANDLFLAGDAMVTWPIDGLVEGGDIGPERSGMFISEIATRSRGLRIRYSERTQVERAVVSVKARLAEVGLGEELQGGGN
jgi:hypothetical protein